MAAARNVSAAHSVTVQLPRDGPAQIYLDKYFGAMKVRVYWGNASDFMRELRERWREHAAR